MGFESFNAPIENNNEKLAELTAKKAKLEARRHELSAKLKTLEAWDKQNVDGFRVSLDTPERAENQSEAERVINERIDVVNQIKEIDEEIAGFSA